MGWTAQQVRSASLWEFINAWRGWRQANASEDQRPKGEFISQERHDWALKTAWAISNPELAANGREN